MRMHCSCQTEAALEGSAVAKVQQAALAACAEPAAEALLEAVLADQGRVAAKAAEVRRQLLQRACSQWGAHSATGGTPAGLYDAAAPTGHSWQMRTTLCSHRSTLSIAADCGFAGIPAAVCAEGCAGGGHGSC